MTFQIESYYDVIDELKPMLAEHYKEVAMYQDKIKLAPDYEAYEQLQDAGMLYILTWRDEDKLKGYNIFFMRHHPHYENTNYAANDVVYIDPESRHTLGTVEFFQWCEAYLNDAGADVITYHMKVMKSFHALMTGLDMDHAEHIYTKYIG